MLSVLDISIALQHAAFLTIVKALEQEVTWHSETSHVIWDGLPFTHGATLTRGHVKLRDEFRTWDS